MEAVLQTALSFVISSPVLALVIILWWRAEKGKLDAQASLVKAVTDMAEQRRQEAAQLRELLFQLAGMGIRTKMSDTPTSALN